jgi:hypothetical protein
LRSVVMRGSISSRSILATVAVEAARPLWRHNGALLSVLRAAADEARAKAEERRNAHEETLEAVYGTANEALTDGDTLRYTGDASSGTPLDWWREARVNACRAMREAHEDGLLGLVDALEPVRGHASVQEVLALCLELSGSPA